MSDDITCRQFHRMMADFLAGQLGGEAAQSGELHLRVCPDCVSYLRDYEVTIRLARAAVRPDEDAASASLPADFEEVILTASRRRN